VAWDQQKYADEVRRRNDEREEMLKRIGAIPPLNPIPKPVPPRSGPRASFRIPDNQPTSIAWYMGPGDDADRVIALKIEHPKTRGLREAAKRDGAQQVPYGPALIHPGYQVRWRLKLGNKVILPLKEPMLNANTDAAWLPISDYFSNASGLTVCELEAWNETEWHGLWSGLHPTWQRMKEFLGPP
jgi:hypothetical protein